jgi:hypothetical protein
MPTKSASKTTARTATAGPAAWGHPAIESRTSAFREFPDAVKHELFEYRMRQAIFDPIRDRSEPASFGPAEAIATVSLRTPRTLGSDACRRNGASVALLNTSPVFDNPYASETDSY